MVRADEVASELPPLLTDLVRGNPASTHYADLDF